MTLVHLITGATSGIGEATAHAIAATGERVLVHGRDPERCERVATAIRARSGNPDVEPIVADLSTTAGVNQLATELHRRLDRLNVLINNAGAMFPAYRENADGIETTLAVNHLAPFLLTHLVLDLLQAGAPSRVIMVASGAHRRATLDFDDLNSRRAYQPREVYARTKLMNLLFTRELARRLDGTRIAVNAAGPGIVHTEFGVKDGMGEDQQRIMAGGKPTEEGARTSVYLAIAPEPAATMGAYFVDCALAETAPNAQDDAAAARLWAMSAALVGL